MFSTASGNSTKSHSASASTDPLVSNDLPHWLATMERGMKYLFCGVAGLSLVAYGCMVYTQEQWRINHRQLQQLQSHERQLAIANARIKNQLATHAQQEKSGLVAPQPDHILFVPANSQAIPTPVEISPNTITSTSSLPGPAGY